MDFELIENLSEKDIITLYGYIIELNEYSDDFMAYCTHHTIYCPSNGRSATYTWCDSVNAKKPGESGCEAVYPSNVWFSVVGGARGSICPSQRTYTCFYVT